MRTSIAFEVTSCPSLTISLSAAVSPAHTSLGIKGSKMQIQIETFWSLCAVFFQLTCPSTVSKATTTKRNLNVFMRAAVLERPFSFMTSGLKYHSALYLCSFGNYVCPWVRDVEKCQRRVGARAFSLTQKREYLCVSNMIDLLLHASLFLPTANVIMCQGKVMRKQHPRLKNLEKKPLLEMSTRFIDRVSGWKKILSRK